PPTTTRSRSAVRPREASTVLQFQLEFSLKLAGRRPGLPRRLLGYWYQPRTSTATWVEPAQLKISIFPFPPSWTTTRFGLIRLSTSARESDRAGSVRRPRCGIRPRNASTPSGCRSTRYGRSEEHTSELQSR